MRVASLDLGTNTFLLLIAEIENGRVTKVLHDEAHVIRLGQDVHKTKRLHPEALERADSCLSEFAETIAKHNVDRKLACATSAARDVENQDELIAVCEKHGLPLRILTGEQEAECTYRGTIDEPGPDPVLIVDVGGGSTEFILGGPSGIRARQSLDIGAVRLTEMFLTQHPLVAAERDQLTSYISEKLRTLPATTEAFARFRIQQITAVAGTPTTLAAIDQGLAFESDRVNGHVLTYAKLEKWVEKLASMSIDERRRLAGMEPKRADVIVAGALILKASADAFGATELIVSTRGLRFGVAAFLGSAK